MRHRTYLYIIVCVLTLLLGVLIYIKDSETDLKIKSVSSPLKENEIWESRTDPSMTIPYSKCWQLFSANFSETILVRSTDDCKDINKYKWDLFYGPTTHNVAKHPHELPPPPKNRPIVKEVDLNGRPTYFYGEAHGYWTVNFKCGGAYFDLENWGFDYVPRHSQNEGQDNEVPEAFKSFIASIKCDEDLSYWSYFIYKLDDILGLQ